MLTKVQLHRAMRHVTVMFDLQSRLAAKGYHLKASGGGLAVFDPKTHRRLAKASHFGTSTATLSRRFAAPVPDFIDRG